MTLPADTASQDSAAIEAAAAARHAFARDLAAFRIRRGERPYAQISKAARRVRLTPSGITDMLAGKRLPSRDFLIEFVRTVEQLGTGMTDSPQSKALVDHWIDRWASAKDLERDARAPRKRVRDAIIEQAESEAAELVAAARREVEAAFAAAGNHQIRRAQAAQLEEEHLRQTQEASEQLLRGAQETAHTILREAQHHQDRATRMTGDLEQRAAHVSDEAERLEAEAERLEAEAVRLAQVRVEAARLARVKEENRVEAARLAQVKEENRVEAARLAQVKEENRVEAARLAQVKEENRAEGTWLESEAARLQAETQQSNQSLLEGRQHLQRLFEALILWLEGTPTGEAFGRYGRIIPIATDLLGAEARETLTLRANYAGVLEECNWIMEARDLLDRLYPLVESSLGTHDSLTNRVKEHRIRLNGTVHSL
ncbi:hypothetical protein ACFCXC_35480 [Streptomyces microflavus]|uniref:hypothetical protein n=1 Tax=Streptomyces microflavus TaxID=1919 RepID=UPI0035D7425E